MKIGVFGPAVNRAARLESATKTLGVSILADEAVIDYLSRGGAGRGAGPGGWRRCCRRG